MEHILSINIAGWLACLWIAIMIVNGGGKFLERFKDHPTPSLTYAKEADCAKRHDTAMREIKDSNHTEDGKRGKIYDQIRATETNLRAEMKDGFRAVDAQLSGITRALGRLEGHSHD